MAKLIEEFPGCYAGLYVVDDEAVPSIDFECVARKLVKAGRVISGKAALKDVTVQRYMEFDGGNAIVKLKGKGWFALDPENEGLKVFARAQV